MPVRKTVVFAISAAVCTGALGGGCTQAPQSPSQDHGTPSSAAPRPAPPRPAAPPPPVRLLPELGPAMQAQVPAGTRQALVVSGRTQEANQARAALYERDTGHGWRLVAGPWRAHNGLRGWTSDHWIGDLRTPIGVFGLSDAGGRLPDPGTRLPYDQDPLFRAEGTGHLGEPLEGSFDYVVAVDYNRVTGTTPLDETRPMGEAKGGGVWIHVDHQGPTSACVSLREDHMRALLRALDPERKPVVVMGPRADLSK
ncbi:hypothetical protein AB0L35_06855 [Streptomyces sp. NPDC052309]|uniref:hypothetical protein n=1 Tax=Streptomyces sp. NPDC052309 TaxID=3155421 RepID=UPI00344A6ADA